MYQIAWQRLLTVYYGVGTISITLIVSVYMFGLGVGALIGGALAERMHDKLLRLYFVVQLLLALFGFVSLPFLDFVGEHTAGSNYGISLWYMGSFLILPTTLMGMTLPLVAKIFMRFAKDLLSTVSYLYFLNAVGAACGALFASYVFISFFGLHAAVYCAAAIDIALAALILRVHFLPIPEAHYQYALHLVHPHGDHDTVLGRLAYPVVLITGFLAIGYEIVWLRVVGVLVKASPYAFSTVLAVYLVGIGVGSLGVARLWPRQTVVGKRNLFFLLQFLVGLYVATTFIGYYYLTTFTPLGGITRASFSTVLHPSFIIPSVVSLRQFLSDTFAVIDVFVWPLVFAFVPTVLMGASFPLITHLSQVEAHKEGKTVGTVYFFNIAGNVLGGILTGFVLLPIMGTVPTLLVFSAIGVLFGLFVTRIAGRQLKIGSRVGIAVTSLALIVALFPKGDRLYETMHDSPGEGFATFIEEGRDGVVVTQQKQDTIYNWINGLGHGGRPGYGFYYEAIEGLSFARQVESVLIVGFGTGSITEMILKMNGVRKVTIVELNPALLKNLEKMPFFRGLLREDRVEVIIDDGRRFLLRTDERFDLIQIDALRATTAYSNNLYSRQFFELAGRHLNEGGVFMVWMDEYRVIPKTTLAAFDHVRVYDFFCLASNVAFVRNDEVQSELLADFSPEERETIATQGSYVGDERFIEEITVGYDVNEDWKPVTEYYLGLRMENSFRLR
jgi:predicted membrane-bound spermidine synthase